MVNIANIAGEVKSADDDLADLLGPPAQSLADAALEWARQGFRVFPVAAGTKDKPLIADWQHAAANDPATVRRWWIEFPHANIGAVPDLSGHIILDLDCKGGKDGIADLGRLEAEHGALPATFTVTTPSGGEQQWLKGQAPSSVGRIGPGIDIRGGAEGGKSRGYGLFRRACAKMAPTASSAMFLWRTYRMRQIGS